MTYLSENFTLEEATFSETATRLGIDNSPSLVQYANMRQAALGMEQVRELLGGQPIKVSSWLRVPKVNEAIGGSGKSSHMDGWAVDFTCPRFGDPYAVAKAISRSGIKYDQLIHEFGKWVHISFAPEARQQNLTIFNPAKVYKQGILTYEEYL
jgi:zinc D-Ala-D-Ala carboxypeptidase